MVPSSGLEVEGGRWDSSVAGLEVTAAVVVVVAAVLEATASWLVAMVIVIVGKY
jgi:hypothetical protein